MNRCSKSNKAEQRIVKPKKEFDTSIFNTFDESPSDD
jgi:hypothetical protein